MKLDLTQIKKITFGAERILETWGDRDGYYAFVCEKCAPVFDYYGYFVTARKLAEQSRRIYEGN